ncbi:MAG: leucine-rich repeat protein [Clostridia bacterium]|nr:leucine-rich repeat protein [Clostridia bacterium]
MKTKIIKKSVSIVLTLLMMLSTIPISAVSADEIIEGTTEDGFKYTIKNEEVTITDYTQYNTEVVIPNTIEGYKVTKIGSYAFYWDHPYITSIVLPIHLKEIGIQAFASCENLDNVIIPSNVQYIGDGAFSKCFKLSNIQIKGNIKYMGSGVFYNTAFQKNSNNWNNNILYLSSILIEANDIVGHCNIKNGTTTIAKRAFWNCVHLKSISLPCTIENICDVAFYTDSAYSNFENHLTDVYYNGTEQKWNSINIDSKNNDLLNARIHFNSVSPHFITDTKTGITINTTADAELKVLDITSSEEINKANILLSHSTATKIYDITLTSSGDEVQPDGEVTVKIPTDNENSQVFRIEIDGTLTDMNAVYEGGFMIFTTEHFSIYILAETKETESTDPSESENTTESSNASEASSTAESSNETTVTEPDSTTSITTETTIVTDPIETTVITEPTESTTTIEETDTTINVSSVPETFTEAAVATNSTESSESTDSSSALVTEPAATATVTPTETTIATDPTEVTVPANTEATNPETDPTEPVSDSTSHTESKPDLTDPEASTPPATFEPEASDSTEASSPDEAEFSKGDVNKDKKLNIRDATLIQKFIAKLKPLDDEAIKLADFDENGKVNVKDATAIQKFIAGIR